MGVHRGACVVAVLAVACGESATPPAGLTGDFHLPAEMGSQVVDAVNLRIEQGGDVVWTVEGCDYCGGDRGRWEADGATLTVSAVDGPLTWFHGTTFRYEVQEVRLSLDEPTGEVQVTGFSDAAQPAFEQIWKPGRMCPNCGSGLGPDGFTLCDEPLPVMSCVGKRGAP